MQQKNQIPDQQIDSPLKNWNKSLIIVAGIVLIFLIGSLDFFSGFEISFSVFYLVPVVLITWFIGKKTGIIASIICAITLYLADWLGGLTFSHPLIAYWNDISILGFFIIVTILISNLKSRLDLENKLARIDYLTGAMNSRAFYEIATHEMKRAERYNRPFTITYLDLDNFKSVNDSLGHHAGDEVLCKVVDTLKKNIRASDVVARLGGDEFALLLPETDYDSSRIAAKKIQDAMNNEMCKNNWPITFSMGVLTCTHPPCSVDDMIKHVDGLMYSIKKEGKNGIKYEYLSDKSELTSPQFD
jgi:diguanylate cyclase (GGDEF)-like protein